MKKLAMLIILLVLVLVLITGCGKQIVPQDQETETLSPLDEQILALQKELAKEGNTILEEELEGLEAAKEEITTIEELEEQDVFEDIDEFMDVEQEPIDLADLEILEVQETELVNLKLNVKDDDNDKVTYTFGDPLSSKGQWKTNYGDEGDYVVDISVSDGELTTTKTILLRVLKKNEAPQIDNIGDKVVKEGEFLRIKPTVKDVNGDEVEVTFSAPLNSDGTWNITHKDAGEYPVTITASDGVLTDSVSFMLTVADVNVPPAFDEIEDIYVLEGETITISPQVVDLDGDSFTIDIQDPVGDDGIWETKYTDHGEYEILVSVSDGKATTNQVVKVEIEDVNRPPEILEISLA